MNDPRFRHITKMGKTHVACLGIACASKVYSAAERRVGPWGPRSSPLGTRLQVHKCYYPPSAIVVVLQLRGAD